MTMTRPPDFRLQPTHARLAQPSLLARPVATQSGPARPAPLGDRQAPDAVLPARARTIPSVSIHAFCETSGTSAALEAAAVDRRLAKAQLEVVAGGIDTAITDGTGERAPNVLIVETTMLSRPQMLAEVNGLIDRCNAATRIVVIGHVNDVALYREFIRRGIGEYLVAPVSPTQVIDAVADLCGVAGTGKPGGVIAFIGAKGGVGSSTVCHNAAWALSETLKSEVVVADLDLAFGTVGLDFNQETMQGMAEALQAPERLDEAALDRLLTKCSQHLSILAAPVALDRDYDVSAGACRTVLDALRQHAPFAAVDLPHAWAPWVKQVLLAADEIVITAAPDLANLRNARNLVDLLEPARTSGKPPRLVINMARRSKRPDLTVDEFALALDLEPTLIIEFDAETFGFAANHGQMIEEFSRKARPAHQFRELALTLAQRPAAKEAVKAPPLLAPILGKLRL
jgi:pilus assembly protein CpaE